MKRFLKWLGIVGLVVVLWVAGTTYLNAQNNWQIPGGIPTGFAGQILGTSLLINPAWAYPSVDVYPQLRVVTDGVTTSSSKTFTSATANFTAADIGQVIAAAGKIPNATTIASVQSATSITLSANAVANGTSVQTTIGTTELSLLVHMISAGHNLIADTVGTGWQIIGYIVLGQVNAQSYGAVADGQYGTDGQGYSTTTLTSLNAGFSSGRDKGKPITVVDVTTGTVEVNTTIVSVTNSTTAVLGATLATGTNYYFAWGTDNTTPGQATIDAIETGALSNVAEGGTIYWPRPGPGFHYYFATTTGLQMNGSSPTVDTQSRPVTMIGDPGSSAGPDQARTLEDVSTFLFPAIPATAPNTIATAGFLNYNGAVGCLAGAHLGNLGFSAYNDGPSGSGVGPVAINIQNQDGVQLGTMGAPLYFGPLGGGIQFINAPNAPQCASAAAPVAGFTETDEIVAKFEYAAQPIRYLVKTPATPQTTVTDASVTLSQSPPVNINVTSTAGFPAIPGSGIIQLAIYSYNGGGSAGTTPLGPILQCAGPDTATQFGNCISGNGPTLVTGAVLGISGHQSFNGSGCRFCYINQYDTPVGVSSIYFGPNSNVYDAPMNIHFFANSSQSMAMQDDANGFFGDVPELYGDVTGEGEGWLGTGVPFRIYGANLAGGVNAGSAWFALNTISFFGGMDGAFRNILPESELSPRTAQSEWTLSPGWSLGSGVQPDGGTGALLTGTGSAQSTIMATKAIPVDGNTVSDGVTTAGSFNLSSATASWNAPRDKGKWVTVAGAGPPAGNGTAATLFAQIVSVTSSTVVVLNVQAGTTVSGALVNWGQIYSISAFIDTSNETVVGAQNGLAVEVVDLSNILIQGFHGYLGQKGRGGVGQIVFGTNMIKMRFNSSGATTTNGATNTVSMPVLEATLFPTDYRVGPAGYLSGLYATPGATPQIGGIPCTALNLGEEALLTNAAASPVPVYHASPVPTATSGLPSSARCYYPSGWLND